MRIQKKTILGNKQNFNWVGATAQIDSELVKNPMLAHD